MSQDRFSSFTALEHSCCFITCPGLSESSLLSFHLYLIFSSFCPIVSVPINPDSVSSSFSSMLDFVLEQSLIRSFTCLLSSGYASPLGPDWGHLHDCEWKHAKAQQSCCSQSFYLLPLDYLGEIWLLSCF